MKIGNIPFEGETVTTSNKTTGESYKHALAN